MSFVDRQSIGLLKNMLKRTNLKTLDKYFHKVCKQNRKRKAKICQVCPFRKVIEEYEKEKY